MAEIDNKILNTENNSNQKNTNDSGPILIFSILALVVAVLIALLISNNNSDQDNPDNVEAYESGDWSMMETNPVQADQPAEPTAPASEAENAEEIAERAIEEPEEQPEPYIEWEYEGKNDKAFNMSPNQTILVGTQKKLKGDTSDIGKAISIGDYTFTGKVIVNGVRQSQSNPRVTSYSFYERWAFENDDDPYDFVGMVTFEGERCRRYNGMAQHYLLLKPNGDVVSRDYREYEEYFPSQHTVKKESFYYYVWGNHMDEYAPAASSPSSSSQGILIYPGNAGVSPSASPSSTNRVSCSSCGGTGSCSNVNVYTSSKTSCHGTGYCSFCGGDGWTDNTYTNNPQRCSICHGSGRCQKCNGTGQCMRCGGSGWL